jgi:hypothetical protein
VRPRCSATASGGRCGAVHGVRNRGQQRIVIVWMFPADSYDEIKYFDA